MPAKKMKNVDIAAMRSEFHNGYQSICDPRKTGYGKAPGKNRALSREIKCNYSAIAVKPTASKMALDSGVLQKSRNA